MNPDATLDASSLHGKKRNMKSILNVFLVNCRALSNFKLSSVWNRGL